MYNILICDDQPDIVNALKIYLSPEGYQIFEAFTGQEAVDIVREHDIQLILLDVMMPVMDGIAATEQIRAFSNAPIILLTAKSETEDKVLGLNAGADDYITKPFIPEEVLARVRSQLRRYDRLGSRPAPSDKCITLGSLTLDERTKSISIDGDPVALTPTEYAILHLLMKNPGKVFSTKVLYESVWQETALGSEGAVAVHIRHLREKIEITPSEPRYLKVVWGQGYKIEEEKKMKHSIPVKFIAIVLCAAALLGVAASGIGIAGLTSLGLYDRTPQQVREETILNRGQTLAYSVAGLYASRELGGCPEPLLDAHHVMGLFNAPYYGYTLRDAEGNKLVSDGITDETAQVVSFPDIGGKYMYLVDVKPVGIPSEEPVIPCTGISIDDSGVQFAQPEQTHQLAVTVIPADTTDPVAYASLDESVAAVDENGLITAVGDGITTIRITCGPHYVDFPVSCQLAEPTEATLAETEPETQPTEAVNAWEEDAWEELTQWVQNEWNMEQWNEGQWQPLSDAIAKSWDVDSWSGEQWAQLKHWVTAEFGEPAPTEETVEETTVPETTEATVPQTEPTISLKELEEESRRLEAERETIPETVLVNGRPVTDYQLYRETYYDHALQQEMIVEYVLLDRPAYTLELRLLPGAVPMDDTIPLLEVLWMYRQLMLPVLLGCLLVFAALMVFLVTAAGRKPKSDEVRAGGLNRMPLELYFGLVFFACALATGVVVETARFRLDQIPLELFLAMSGGILYVCCLLAVGFLFALSAQIKSHIWFQQSLVGLCWRVILWVWHKLAGLLPTLLRWLKAGWNGIAGAVRFACVRISRLFTMLPLVWQWLIIGLVMLLGLVISLTGRNGVLSFLCILADFLIVLYGAYAFGRLLDGTKRMSQGELDARIEDKHLLGGFRTFAQNLNALAGTAKTAALSQLKSERMKTELITNVSHDIKTPLTSIVSYVDLLQKPHTEEEEQQYLEVLSRQSQQLKKLIEDLIEMSKASTGNMTVDIGLVDAVESVNQALGEFADKLDKAMLTPVFRHSEDTVPMMADGKLVWRVLHNLLSNAVKYALPGTRLYIDLMEVEGKVILSMKNVSREELNVDADELMERFVRGDDARNTEGSGLGLNIAKSMMELQKGQLQLLVDGDLFKVTLIFPGA